MLLKEEVEVQASENEMLRKMFGAERNEALGKTKYYARIIGRR
jgi:hypothetical protein